MSVTNEISQDRIEAVAHAMWEERCVGVAYAVPWQNIEGFRRDETLKQARAALLADAPALAAAEARGRAEVLTTVREAISEVFAKGYISSALCRKAIDARIAALGKGK
jgi:hypothetical protein